MARRYSTISVTFSHCKNCFKVSFDFKGAISQYRNKVAMKNPIYHSFRGFLFSISKKERNLWEGKKYRSILKSTQKITLNLVKPAELVNLFTSKL